MTHVTNIYDYRKEDAINKFIFSFNGGSKKVQFENHVKWAKKFHIGRPKATEHLTSECLEESGFIGLYDTKNENHI